MLTRRLWDWNWYPIDWAWHQHAPRVSYMVWGQWYEGSVSVLSPRFVYHRRGVLGRTDLEQLAANSLFMEIMQWPTHSPATEWQNSPPPPPPPPGSCRRSQIYHTITRSHHFWYTDITDSLAYCRSAKQNPYSNTCHRIWVGLAGGNAFGANTK